MNCNFGYMQPSDPQIFDLEGFEFTSPRHDLTDCQSPDCQRTNRERSDSKCPYDGRAHRSGYHRHATKAPRFVNHNSLLTFEQGQESPSRSSPAALRTVSWLWRRPHPPRADAANGNPSEPLQKKSSAAPMPQSGRLSL